MFILPRKGFGVKKGASVSNTIFSKYGLFNCFETIDNDVFKSIHEDKNHDNLFINFRISFFQTVLKIDILFLDFTHLSFDLFNLLVDFLINSKNLTGSKFHSLSINFFTILITITIF